MMEIFPPEIVTEILIRLPVQSLLRFRCVSKSWCAEIDHPTFIKTHLKKCKETDSSRSLLYLESPPDFLNWVSFDSLNTALEMNNLSLASLSSNRIANPLWDELTGNNVTDVICMVGSCNGLVYLRYAYELFVLMNPSTRKHHILPRNRFQSKLAARLVISGCTFGFGYDPISDDYKIVRISFSFGFRGWNSRIDVDVYNLKSNSWRNSIPVTSDVPSIFKGDYGVLLHDALHWLGRLDRNSSVDSIVGFDLGVEEFRKFLAPEVENPDINVPPYLGVLEECLSISVIHKDTMRLDIWVMKEYRVKESWTRLFSVELNVVASVNWMRTLSFSKNHDHLLLGVQGSNILWYNIDEECLKNMKSDNELTPVCLETFHGSLIPLNANKGTELIEGSSSTSKERLEEEVDNGMP